MTKYSKYKNYSNSNMADNALNNDMIKKIRKIDDKFTKKYLKDDFRDFYNDVIENKCKDFRDNIFYKQVADLDEELIDFFPKYKEYKRRTKKIQKRLRIYSDSEDENEDENNENDKRKTKK